MSAQPYDQAAIDAAVAAERERCASICELWDDTHPHRLAEEIRKGADRQAPRFAAVSCSQCGQSFGPGDAGYSHCSDHNRGQ